MHELLVGTGPFEDMLATTKREIIKDDHQMSNFVGT